MSELPKILVTMAHMAVGTIAYKEVKETIDAVAEYIAANDEYDAAQVTLSLANIHGDVGDGAIRAACQALARADLRRASAHARMKGETK